MSKARQATTPDPRQPELPLPGITTLRYVPLGDGSFKAIPVKPEQWLTVKSAARAAAVSDDTIRRWIEDGRIRCRRGSPRTTRVCAESLSRYLAGCEDPTTWN